jgi:hypothetical protein
VNFVFTALILGFTTVKTKLTLKRILGTVWHEGMPMLLYAQALIWGEHNPSLNLFHPCTTLSPLLTHST